MRGRPKRTPLDKIKAKAWFAAIKRCSGATSAYSVGNLFNAVVDKRFDKYVRGVMSPNAKTLKDVYKKFPCTRAVYEIGPDSQNGNAPLWIALAGSMEKVWEILVRFDPELEKMRQAGAPIATRVQRIKYAVVPRDTVLPGGYAVDRYPMDYIAWSKGLELNILARLYEEGAFTVSMDQLVAVIAMWRLTMFIGDSTMEMSYLMAGLMPKALKDLLGPYDVDEDVKVFIRQIEKDDIGGVAPRSVK